MTRGEAIGATAAASAGHQGENFKSRGAPVGKATRTQLTVPLERMPEPVRPLSHIKVVDLTRARSGPTCVRQLREMGAQVIKVEAANAVEDDGTGERHGFDFQNIHPNKRSLTLNLKHPDGHAVLRRLVTNADVVAETFPP